MTFLCAHKRYNIQATEQNSISSSQQQHQQQPAQKSDKTELQLQLHSFYSIFAISCCTIMNFGQRGRDLLNELKRSDWVPAYNEEGVRGTIEEISLHYKEIKDIAQTAAAVDTTAAAASKPSNKQHQIPLQVKPAFLLHEASIQRNKRCLLAYHMYRLEKIKQLRWDCTILSPAKKSLLSEAEIDFYSQYDELIYSYTSNMDAVFSPSSLSPLPPSEDDYFVEVRVAANGVGRITTEDGKSVCLDAGTTHHLRRSDVEHLIRQGLLHQLHVEEN